MPNWSGPFDFVKAVKSAKPPENDSLPNTAANGSGSEVALTVVPPGAKGSLDGAESFIARSELAEEELNGSEPPSCELNGSTSPALFILLPNGSESTALSAAELKGSLDAGGGLAVLDAKGSGAPDEDDDGAGASLALAAKRSGSGIPGVVPNGSAEAEKGSFEGKVLLEGWLKKESAAKGSEPLNGSPPKGSATSAFPKRSSLNGSWSVKGSDWKKSISGREGGLVCGGRERGPTCGGTGEGVVSVDSAGSCWPSGSGESTFSGVSFKDSSSSSETSEETSGATLLFSPTGFSRGLEMVDRLLYISLVARLEKRSSRASFLLFSSSGVFVLCSSSSPSFSLTPSLQIGRAHV